MIFSFTKIWSQIILICNGYRHLFPEKKALASTSLNSILYSLHIQSASFLVIKYGIILLSIIWVRTTQTPHLVSRHLDRVIFQYLFSVLRLGDGIFLWLQALIVIIPLLCQVEPSRSSRFKIIEISRSIKCHNEHIVVR